MKEFNLRLNNLLFYGGVMPLTLVLTLLFLGNKSVWLDEAFSVTIAQMKWSDFFHTVSNYEANQGFYYFLLHFWVNLGNSEFILRSLSVIFALGTVVAIYRFGTYLNGARTGFTAALLITINAFFITYAQEARGYMLALLLTTLSSYFFLNAIEKSEWKWWLGYVPSIVLGMYSHLYAIFVLIAQYITIVFLPRRDIPWKQLIISGAATVILFLPMIIFILTRDIGQIDWMPLPRFWDVARVFNRLSGQGGLVTMIVYFISGAAACVLFIRMFLKQRINTQTWRFIFLLSWLLVPIILAFSFSYIKPIFEVRYFVLLLTPFVLLVTIGLDFLKKRWLYMGAVAIFLLVSILPLRDWYTSNPKEGFNQKEDWRDITSYIVTTEKPGDAIVFFHPVARLPFDYYLDRLKAMDNSPVVIHYLPEAEKTLDIYSLPQGSSFGKIPDPDISILDRLSGHDRVWLVLSHTFDKQKRKQGDMLLNFLKEKYDIMYQKTYYIDIRVFLLKLKESPAG